MSSNNTSNNNSPNWSNIDEYFPSEINFIPINNKQNLIDETNSLILNLTKNSKKFKNNQSQWMKNILLNQSTIDNNEITKSEELRSFWENRIINENIKRRKEEMSKKSLQKNKNYLFPRWRSVDPMTASLVASKETIQIIPSDSLIPQHREEKLINTEKMAKMDKFELHKPYIQMAIYKEQKIKGRSLLAYKFEFTPEELAKRRTMDLFNNNEENKWYDPKEISQSVSYEHISSVNKMRKVWEK